MAEQPTLDMAALVEALSRPEAYPHSVDTIEVHQTHISVVFLAGPFAYKIKRPVNLGFLDFSTLDKRKHFCEEEVRLNRRLAPQVYLGVVPIISEPDAQARVTAASLACASSSVCANLHIGGFGPVIEWAVQMKRLPSAATLESRLERGEVTGEQIRAMAERIAAFHRKAEANPRIASFGRFAVVADNAEENFAQAASQIGMTVSQVVFDRVRERTKAHLLRHRDLIESRAAQGVPRDTHGDLHLDHVYHFPDEPPPNDLVIIDCIEFADRFRYADPVADMAFLSMDLTFHGRRDLARVFADAYFAASGDADGRKLLPFYSAYRAVVRAKVEGMELSEKEIAREERKHAEQRARAHWLLALGELEAPARRPALLLIAGLPGSGKSTLARSLAESANFSVLRSDVIRKELAGAPEAIAQVGAGIYTEAWSERTYGVLLQRSEGLLRQGERIVIDANFRDDRRRKPFFDAARHWGVPVLFIHCTATADVTRARLQARRHDASDADSPIYEHLEQTWQPVGEEWQGRTYALDTGGTIAENESRLGSILKQEGLL